VYYVTVMSQNHGDNSSVYSEHHYFFFNFLNTVAFTCFPT